MAFLGCDDPNTYPQNGKVGVIDVTGGEHRWISTDVDRTFAPYPGARPPIWLDDNTLLVSAEDHGECHLFRLTADGSAPPEQVTAGPSASTPMTPAGAASRWPRRPWNIRPRS